MTTIELCKRCKNRKSDFHKGIICGLSNEKPSFTDTCPDFAKDELIPETKLSSLKPNGKRADTLLLLIKIVLGLEVLSLVSSALQYKLLQTVTNGGEISTLAANANDLREMIIGILYLAAYILSGIAFLLWFRRAYFNLHLRVRRLSYTEDWAIWSWFIPIANLYIPFLIMKELYESTKRYLIEREISIRFELTTKLLGIWWALWILNGIFGQIVFRFSRHASTLEELITITKLDIAGAITGIVLAFITIKIIKDYVDVEVFMSEYEEII